MAKTNTKADAIRLTAFGGSWDPIRNFAPAEYTLGVSDFTTDPTSIIPLPATLPIRATHSSYPVNVTVGPSTNKVDNRAPWGLGANFVEFVPAASGTLSLSFDGADGYAWRALVVVTPKNGGSPTTYTISRRSPSRDSARDGRR